MSDLLYTSEPMVTRALAAEIRHRPGKFIELLRKTKPEALEVYAIETFRDVVCESKANTDILLRFERNREIAIEAKLDHFLSRAQVEKQKKTISTVFVLVLDEHDASHVKGLIDGIITWEEALECFPDSRLTIEDINSLPAQKVSVERQFRVLVPGIEKKLGHGWLVEVDRGGRGLPTINIFSPHISISSAELTDRRQLRAQIQVAGRRMPANASDLEFEFHVGIETRPSSKDFPKSTEIVDPPAWIRHLLVLDKEVIKGDREKFRLRGGHSSNGRRGVGRNKSGLVAKFMPGKSWLASGYYDWCLGPKSVVVGMSELDSLIDDATMLISEWYRVSE